MQRIGCIEHYNLNLLKGILSLLPATLNFPVWPPKTTNCQMPFFYSLLYFQIILWNKPFWLSNSKILGDNTFTFPKNCLFWRILRVLPVPSFRHLTSWFNYFCEILYAALFPFAALLPNASFLISSPFWQQCNFYLFFPTWFIFLRTPYCLILNCNTLCSCPKYIISSYFYYF